MGYTSSEVKARYNKKTYRTFGANIRPELFNELDEYCKSHGLSKSEFLKLALSTLKNQDTQKE